MAGEMRAREGNLRAVSLRAALPFLALSLLSADTMEGQEDAATVAPPSQLEHLRDAIRERVANDIPSVAIAVSVGGRVIWQEAFGYADVEARIPATPTTVYPIASVSKSITAAGVAVFCERYGSRLMPRSRLTSIRPSSTRWPVRSPT